MEPLRLSTDGHRVRATPGLQKVHRKVWAPAQELDAVTHARAALLALPQAVLADDWAAWSLCRGRLGAPRLPVRVAIPQDDWAVKRNGLFVRHTLLLPSDIAMTGDLAATGATRTAADVLCSERRLGRYRVIEIVDHLLNLKLTTQAEIQAVLDQSHQRGVVRVRDARNRRI